MHGHDIGMPWTNRPPTLTSGPAARLTLDEMVTSMGLWSANSVKRRRVRVAIELTGPLTRTSVAVDGRSQLVADFGGQHPTAPIRLDGVLFTRLAGGRAEPGAGGIQLSGDQEVASRIVEHLNYTI
jgi:hypothetical protein